MEQASSSAQLHDNNQVKPDFKESITLIEFHQSVELGV